MAPCVGHAIAHMLTCSDHILITPHVIMHSCHTVLDHVLYVALRVLTSELAPVLVF